MTKYLRLSSYTSNRFHLIFLIFEENYIFFFISVQYLAEWLERLTANAEVVLVLRSIPASSDTVESKGSANLVALNNVLKNPAKNPLLFNIWIMTFYTLSFRP
jgi:hypothetical protein